MKRTGSCTYCSATPIAFLEKVNSGDYCYRFLGRFGTDIRTEAYVCVKCGHFDEHVQSPEKVDWDRGETPWGKFKNWQCAKCPGSDVRVFSHSRYLCERSDQVWTVVCTGCGYTQEFAVNMLQPLRVDIEKWASPYARRLEKQTHGCPHCDGTDIWHFSQVLPLKYCDTKDSRRYLADELDFRLLWMIRFWKSCAPTQALVCSSCGFVREWVENPQQVDWKTVPGFRWYRE